MPSHVFKSKYQAVMSPSQIKPPSQVTSDQDSLRIAHKFRMSWLKTCFAVVLSACSLCVLIICMFYSNAMKTNNMLSRAAVQLFSVHNSSETKDSRNSTSHEKPMWESPDDMLSRHPCVQANLTIVSAFIDLGKFRKGSHYRSASEYLEWSGGWAYIHTPLVFYTDSRVVADQVRQVRSQLPPALTTVIMIDRNRLWPFHLRGSIAALYSQKGYPRFHPNTVLPEYSCVQHSKYAIMLDVILHRDDVTRSDVYAWMDQGYFRKLKDKKDYCLVLPRNFSSAMVSFNQIHVPDFSIPAKSVYYGNKVWVGGGMFVATRNTMLTFCTEYHRSVEYWLLKRNLSSTDQQNLYATFTQEGQREIAFRSKIQVATGHHGWMQMGFSCLHPLSRETVKMIDALYQ